MPLKTQCLYEFGEFLFDPVEGVVRRNGEPLRLTPKAFHLLKILVENHGHLVEKDDLISAVWADSFVEDGNLTVSIAMLRKALGDNAGIPTLIETVPRRGYRFIAAVEMKPLEARSAGGASDIIAGQQKNLRKEQYLIVGVAVILVLAAIGWFASGLNTSSPRSAPILSRPYKVQNFSTSGSVHAVITPDGRFVAYTNESGSGQSIWLRNLDTSENIQIVPPNAYEYLGFAISHDGNSLYFVRRTPNEPASSAIYRVGTFGGIPVKVSERTEGWIAISPDDRQISYVRCNKLDNDFCSLNVADADGGGERTLFVRPRPTRITANKFTPDGKSLVFSEGQSSTGGSDFRLMRVDLQSGTESQISPRTFFNIRALEWLPDKENLLVAAMEDLDGVSRIWRASSITGEIQILTNDATNYAGISLDKAAEKMVATHITNNFRLHVAPINELTKTSVLTKARNITFATNSKIVYSADDRDLWSIDLDGAEQHQLTNNPFTDFAPRASPDGKFIFFGSNRSGENHVWRMNVDGSDQIQITKDESGYPRFAPDGNSVFFVSGQRQTLWRVSFGGRETQISEKTVVSPDVSLDGKLAACVLTGENDGRVKIAVMSAEDGTILKTFSPTDKGSYNVQPIIVWERNKRSFLFLSADGSKNLLWSQPVDNGPARLLGNLGGDHIEDMALSPDGNTIAFTRGRWIHNAVLLEGLK